MTLPTIASAITAIEAEIEAVDDKRGRLIAALDSLRLLAETDTPPTGPYLEMFARQPVAGWDVWGNESSGERLSA